MIYGTVFMAGFVFFLEKSILIITFKVKVYKDK